MLTEEEMLAQMDREADDMNYDRTSHLKNMIEIYEKYDGSSKIEIVWRIARAACAVFAAAEKCKASVDKQLRLLDEALKWSYEAVALDVQSIQSHLYLSIFLAKKSGLASRFEYKDRINEMQAALFHADEALRMEEDNFWPHHIYGRVYYELSSLSWFERKLVTMYSNISDKISYKHAYERFRMAEDIEPLSRTNVVWMAMCLVKMKQYEEAIQLAKKAATIEFSLEEDYICEDFRVSILNKYLKTCESDYKDPVIRVRSETCKWRI